MSAAINRFKPAMQPPKPAAAQGVKPQAPTSAPQPNFGMQTLSATSTATPSAFNPNRPRPAETQAKRLDLLG